MKTIFRVTFWSFWLRIIREIALYIIKYSIFQIFYKRSLPEMKTKLQVGLHTEKCAKDLDLFPDDNWLNNWAAGKCMQVDYVWEQRT